MSTHKGDTSSRPSKKPRIHETHCDPNVDVILISNDNVEFHASSFQLCKISKFFSDAFTLPPPPNQNREPIQLDFPENVISIFLDLVNTPEYLHQHILDKYTQTSPGPLPLSRSNLQSLSQPQNNLQMIGNLRSLVDFTDCEKLLRQIDEILPKFAKQYPFELLIIASNQDNLKLAKIAVREMVHVVGTPHDFNPFRESRGPTTRSSRAPLFKARTNTGWDEIRTNFSRLNQEYQAELFTLLFWRCERKEDHSIGLTKHDWQRISECFDPSKLISQTINHGRPIKVQGTSKQVFDVIAQARLYISDSDEDLIL